MSSDESFDPKTWGAVAGAAPAAAAPLPPVATAAPMRFDAGAPIMRAGLAGTILLAGGLTAYLSREVVPIAPSTVAAAAVASPVSETRRTLVLAGLGGLRAALDDAGIAPADADAVIAAAATVLGGHDGEVRATLGFGDSRFMRLDLAFADGASGVVERRAGGFTAASTAAVLDTQIGVVRGEMDANSFYSSAVSAGIVDTLIPAFASALAFDFDFQREIRPGDVFEAAFAQSRDAGGRPIGLPKLVFASIATAAKSRALYWYAAEGETGGWFDGNGTSTVRALMRTPVDGARVSSQFGMRTHPVLGYQKLHRGTDFAAPTGTPIYAAGAATIEFAGPKGPNGNFVKLRHTNGWETLYLHMDRFGAGVTTGAAVAQGQEIGAVGTTGRSTGPHLHYEVHIDSEPVDPQTIEMASARRLEGDARASFILERNRIDTARAVGSGI